MFQKIIKAVFSKTTLVIISALLIGLVIWFIGPMLNIGSLRPLEGVGIRVTVLVLLALLGILILVGWSIGVVVLGLACLLIWHGGPVLAFSTFKPLASETSRIVVISLLVLAYVIYMLFRLWQAMRNDKEFLNKFLRISDADKEGQERADMSEVNRKVADALSRLRRMRLGATGWTRWLEGKRYLYELPWYLVLGSPGAGKTTSILNSGLKFPLAEQLGSTVLTGQVGTANCDWWLTNEAVIIDTAGRYSSHESAGALDADEWRGFLKLLRKYRPRAPVNGALLVMSVEEVLAQDPNVRKQFARNMRERLADLRSQLGIRFPVYVVVTKMDLITGFTEYFHTLSAEGRAQVWGFTLPYGAETEGVAAGQIKQRCEQELQTLTKRLDMGLAARLHEEYDLLRRQKLYTLPLEVQSVSESMVSLLEDIFMDSRFDQTQMLSTLRGVYFTSAAQGQTTVLADKKSIVKKVRHFVSTIGRNEALEHSTSDAQNVAVTEEEDGADLLGLGLAKTQVKSDAPASNKRAQPQSFRSYFLQDLFSKLIFSEAHLVRPNLAWEARFRLLKLFAHALVILIFLWIASGLLESMRSNSRYLDAVEKRIPVLGKSISDMVGNPKTENVPDLLNTAQDLPSFPGLNINAPDLEWGFGLYSAPPVDDAARKTYQWISQRYLLTHIVHQMETRMQKALDDKDANEAYNALRVYLMLNDEKRFKEGNGTVDVRDWILRDWELYDTAADFGGRTLVAPHLDHIFVEGKIVHSPLGMNDALVREVRTFLEGSSRVSRLYERAKAFMMPDAPEDFTMTRVLGPQAGTLFIRSSDAPLDQGVMGLFTRAGYHDLFNRRLKEFLIVAQNDDDAVMGRNRPEKKNSNSSMFSDVTSIEKVKETDTLAQEVRRLYLEEYAALWADYLSDIHAITYSTNGASASDAAASARIGTNLGFELQVARSLAAPDSPLIKFVRAVAFETTLSRSLNSADKSLAERAAEQIEKKAKQADAALGMRVEERIEKQIVDNQFSALREIVVGSSEMTPGAAPGAAKGIENITGLLNDYYTGMVVADNSLMSKSVPPNLDVGSKLRLEAAKLPAPFKAVLSDLATAGVRKMSQGVGDILQAQMESQVGSFCRRAIEGKYPMTDSLQEVAIEDFSRLFASGGLMDEFFNKTLAPYVDTSTRPWHYKQASADLPAVRGPSLDAFMKAAALKDVFFREGDGKKFGWKMDLKFIEVDPQIVQMIADIDGQALRYVHGPVVAQSISWPGPRGGTMSELTANPRISPATSTILVNGPWALFRLIDKGKIIPSAQASRIEVRYNFDGRNLTLDLSSGSAANPLSSDVLRGFKCPSQL